MAIESLLIIIGVLAVLLIIGVPISYSIGIASLVAILQTVSLDVSVVTGAQRIFVGMSKFSLTAIPFFILAGNLMNQGGIAKRLVDFVMAILGKLPGALLVTNIGANALFGAISGSASAAAAAVGSMVEKGEEEQGYDKALCAAKMCIRDRAKTPEPAARGGMQAFIRKIFWRITFMQIRLSDHFSYRKLLRFTLPSIVMMIVASIYSVVDGLFVSNLVGDLALSAVNIIFPATMIIGAEMCIRDRYGYAETDVPPTDDSP